MKAIVKSKAEVGLWLEDVPEPEIGINDVLIKIEKTGICGTGGAITPVPAILGSAGSGLLRTARPLPAP